MSTKHIGTLFEREQSAPKEFNCSDHHSEKSLEHVWLKCIHLSYCEHATIKRIETRAQWVRLNATRSSDEAKRVLRRP
jgi:hypothetical protein